MSLGRIRVTVMVILNSPATQQSGFLFRRQRL